MLTHVHILNGFLTVLVTRVHVKRRNIGMKPGSSETLSRLEGGCYSPTLGLYDTSAITAWYTPNPIES